MNKSELVSFISEKTGSTKTDVAKNIDAFVEAVTETLKKDDTLTLVGFGTFKVSKRAARAGRNPKTGEVIQIKAAKVPRFTPGKSLKDTVNN